MNRIVGDCLWDDVGEKWIRMESNLDAELVDSLLRDQTVRVVVQDHYHRPLRWVPFEDAVRHWVDNMRPHYRADGSSRHGNTIFGADLFAIGTRKLLLLTAD